jgi:hypothetical protein
VLIDLNNDAQWSASGAPPFPAEWVVVDFPVNIAPGTTLDVAVPSFLYPLSPIEKWMRVALTRTPIAGSFPDDGSGWDGSGSFTHGEIEDFLLASDLAFANASARDAALAFAFKGGIFILVCFRGGDVQTPVGQLRVHGRHAVEQRRHVGHADANDRQGTDDVSGNRSGSGLIEISAPGPAWRQPTCSSSR